LTSVPALDSLPGATDKIYLDFVGAPAMNWGGYSVPATPAYDIDGDPTTFSSTELANITQIWSIVAEKYSPFDIDVTTVDPSPITHTYPHLQDAWIIIGGTDGWLGETVAGISYTSGFAYSFLPNTSFVFPASVSDNTTDIGDAAAHEAGHEFGLNHQSIYSGTTLVAEYNTGTSLAAPIMGDPYNSAQAQWWDGPNDQGYNVIQDDMTVIASSANGFGYRPDENGNSIATAGPLAISGTSVSASGVIDQTTDADVFSFTTGSGSITLNVNVAQYGAMLHAQEVLETGSGSIIASADNASTLGQTITTTVAAGTYYLFVESYQYGTSINVDEGFDVGQYTVSGNLAASAPTFAISGSSTVNEQSAYALSLSATDPGQTVSGWVINWGDGNTQDVTGNPSSVAHTYSAGPSNYTISASAADGTGTYNASNTIAVSVAHVPPTLTLSGAASVNEGSLYTLSLSGAELAGHAISAWSINWGDGNTQLVSGNPSSVTHTYALGPQSDTITASATDDVSTYSAGNSVVVSVLHVPPTVTISGASSVNEQSTYTLNLSAVEVASHTISGWVITWGDASAPQDLSGNPSSVTHAYATGPHTYIISATATDNVSTYPASQTVTVNVDHVPPTLALSGASSVNEDSVFTLGLSGIELAGHAISAWSINWGDGNTQTVSGNPSSVNHTYLAANTYTISASATDDVSTYAATPLNVTVNKVPPTLLITGASTGAPASAYTLGLSATEPDSDTIIQWVINWGDGNSQTVSGNPSSVTHTYAGLGSFTISAQASDQHGSYSANSMGVTINASLPVANAGGPYTVNEGGTVALSGAASSGTDLTYAWDLNGNGIFGETGSAATSGDETGVSPTYKAGDQPGPYVVTLKVTDTFGQTSTATAVVTVLHMAPALTITGPSTVNENTPYTLSLSAIEPDSYTILSWAINWGDGSGIQTITGDPSNVSHTYQYSSMPLTISATATDVGGTYSANSLAISVLHVPPTVVISGSDSTTAGSQYTLNLSATDPGHVLEGWTVNWGDGVIDTLPWSATVATHSYPYQANPFNITATLADDVGSFASNTLSVSVSEPVAADSQLTITATTATIGSSTASFDVTFSNPAGVDLAVVEAIQILVAGPINYTQTAVQQSVVSSNATSATLSFVVSSPGSQWTANDNGTYTISAVASGSPQSLGTFAIAETHIDRGGKTLKTAANLGKVAPGFNTAIDSSVGPFDLFNYYRIQVTKKAGLTLTVSGLIDTVVVQLLNAHGHAIYSQTAGIGQSTLYQSITAPGTYYIEVAGPGNLGTDYTMDLTSVALPVDKAGNTLVASRNLGLIGPKSNITISDSLSPFDTQDDYHFTVAKNVVPSLDVSGLADGATVQLLNRGRNVVATLSLDANGDASYSGPLVAGLYYIKAISTSQTWSNYTLHLGTTAAAKPAPPSPTAVAMSDLFSDMSLLDLSFE
jgi:hypothetical protein